MRTRAGRLSIVLTPTDAPALVEVGDGAADDQPQPETGGQQREREYRIRRERGFEGVDGFGAIDDCRGKRSRGAIRRIGDPDPGTDRPANAEWIQEKDAGETDQDGAGDGRSTIGSHR